MSGSDVYHHAISNISIVLGALQVPSGDAEIQAGTDSKVISIDGEQSFRTVFDPPLEISSAYCSQLTVQWNWRHRYRNLGLKQEKCIVSLAELQANGQSNQVEHELQKMHNKTQVIISHKVTTRARQGGHTGNAEGLISEVERIVEICPRFRILIVGKAGVGKTSLIKFAFGVDDAKVSNYQPGEAEIDHEYISKENKRFVLHDSKGFESGDEHNFETVQDFIRRRMKMRDLKDRLHAVWLCFSTPRAGDRFLETGSEEFLRLKMSGDLGDIPVIAVFTKFDILVTRVKRTIAQQGSSLRQSADHQVEDNFQKSCVAPLKQLVGESVPYIAVSTKPGSEKSLSDLVSLTYENVTKHVSKDVSVVTAIAQRVNPKLKIDESISVGSRRYWSGLVSGGNFTGYTIRNCLAVVHNDIIDIWNFNDEYKHLHSNEFRRMMMGMADDAYNSNGGIISNVPPFSVSILSAASLFSNFTVKTGALVVGGIFCQWVLGTYTNAVPVLQRFMTYIVDLTLIMQTLFALVAGGQAHLTRRLIKIAYLHYRNSKEKNAIHYKIQMHVKDLSLIRIFDQDPVLETMDKLIRDYPINNEEMSTLRMKLRSVHGQGDDEPWDQVAAP